MRTQVAIIGGGPVGLTLANLLGRRGISTVVLEQRPHPYPMPRAIHFDGEAMRIFQAAGLSEQILPHTMVGKGMLFKDADGRTLIDWSREQTIGPMGWFESYRFFQPGVENALRDGLSRFSHVRLLTGQPVSGISQSLHGVTIQVADGTAFNAQYAVACDGARSAIRDQLGISVEDLGFNERWMVCDLLLSAPRPDLGDHSIQYCDPKFPATYVRGVGNWRRWECRLEADAPQEPDDKEVWARLARWIRPDEASLERAAVYTFRSAIAERWGKGRIFIAGDAAHQMPPFMGQGMCAGIRDAGNLAWKLSAVLHGAEPALLRTYEDERQPHLRAFIELTLALGRLINATAQGHLPEGRMKSIWPGLGPGLGPRDAVSGALAPQPRTDGDGLGDDLAHHGFYLITRAPVNSHLPVFVDSENWLGQHELSGALIRPDGYVLDTSAVGEAPEDMIARYPFIPALPLALH